MSLIVDDGQFTTLSNTTAPTGVGDVVNKAYDDKYVTWTRVGAAYTYTEVGLALAAGYYNLLIEDASVNWTTEVALAGRSISIRGAGIPVGGTAALPKVVTSALLTVGADSSLYLENVELENNTTGVFDVANTFDFDLGLDHGALIDSNAGLVFITGAGGTTTVTLDGLSSIASVGNFSDGTGATVNVFAMNGCTATNYTNATATTLYDAAGHIDYDNAGATLVATDVNAAIDELDGKAVNTGFVDVPGAFATIELALAAGHTQIMVTGAAAWNPAVQSISGLTDVVFMGVSGVAVGAGGAIDEDLIPTITMASVDDLTAVTNLRTIGVHIIGAAASVFSTTVAAPISVLYWNAEETSIGGASTSVVADLGAAAGNSYLVARSCYYDQSGVFFATGTTGTCYVTALDGTHAPNFTGTTLFHDDSTDCTVALPAGSSPMDEQSWCPVGAAELYREVGLAVAAGYDNILIMEDVNWSTNLALDGRRVNLRGGGIGTATPARPRVTMVAALTVGADAFFTAEGVGLFNTTSTMFSVGNTFDLGISLNLGTVVDSTGQTFITLTTAGTSAIYMDGMSTVTCTTFCAPAGATLNVWSFNGAEATNFTGATNVVLDAVAAGGVVASAAAPTTVDAADGTKVLLMTTGGGGAQVNLPAVALANGRIINIKKVDAGVGNLTIATPGGGTIDGAATLVHNTQWRCDTLVCDGSNWYVV